MAGLSDLPDELTLQIAHHLKSLGSQGDLSHLCQASKSLRRVASEVLYESPSVESYEPFHLEFPSLSLGLLNHPELARKVQHLNFSINCTAQPSNLNHDAKCFLKTQESLTPQGSYRAECNCSLMEFEKFKKSACEYLASLGLPGELDVFNPYKIQGFLDDYVCLILTLVSNLEILRIRYNVWICTVTHTSSILGLLGRTLGLQLVPGFQNLKRLEVPLQHWENELLALGTLESLTLNCQDAWTAGGHHEGWYSFAMAEVSDDHPLISSVKNLQFILPDELAVEWFFERCDDLPEFFTCFPRCRRLRLTGPHKMALAHRSMPPESSMIDCQDIWQVLLPLASTLQVFVLDLGEFIDIAPILFVHDFDPSEGLYTFKQLRHIAIPATEPEAMFPPQSLETMELSFPDIWAEDSWIEWFVEDAFELFKELRYLRFYRNDPKRTVHVPAEQCCDECNERLEYLNKISGRGVEYEFFIEGEAPKGSCKTLEYWA
ncbi:hypothetical protein P154DRAFT_237592 [Amniculicola lignicola CBS 123094]|uniref:Uncharacterized protein n=1 Tax=Amniculicola lignicola CBS 123094 TaxID=1392246 RepID=A0A6A5WAR1_9PLEO|nr:hypothetical protein P154DRAFT_237592 [Amniculicola lignicola CBS 123094]